MTSGPVCVLHAGTEKTGSTSLQHALRLNADTLAAQGIWVPRALVGPPAVLACNHIRLSTASRFTGPTPDDLQRAQGLTSMADVPGHRAEVIAALAAEHAALPFAPRLILVSNEHVHSRLRALPDLTRARDLLAPFCASFRVVTYLRRQDDLAASIAAMMLRHGATTARLVPDFNTPHGFDDVLGVDAGYFDYAALLDRLEAVFGAASLSVRLYQPALDVVADFFTAIGVDSAGLRRPARQNTGLDARGMALLLRLNAEIAAHPPLVELRHRLLPHLATRAAETLPAPGAAAFLARYAATNEAVRRRWFPARPHLFAPLPAATAPLPVPLDDAQTAALVQALLAPGRTA